jgi:hypothetical protein
MKLGKEVTWVTDSSKAVATVYNFRGVIGTLYRYAFYEKNRREWLDATGQAWLCGNIYEDHPGRYRGTPQISYIGLFGELVVCWSLLVARAGRLFEGQLGLIQVRMESRTSDHVQLSTTIRSPKLLLFDFPYLP